MTRVPLRLTIADDRAALILLEIPQRDPQRRGPLIGPHGGSHRALRNTVAVRLPPRRAAKRRRRESVRDSICDDDRRLLALLAAGVPDAIIGRQLGISPNTVQRRIHALMARLGAATRFQAGLHTALHGWINTPSRTAQTAR